MASAIFFRRLLLFRGQSMQRRLAAVSRAARVLAVRSSVAGCSPLGGRPEYAPRHCRAAAGEWSQPASGRRLPVAS